jgi:hypothetical protein
LFPQEAEDARRTIGEIAKAMLAGETSFLSGSRKINALRFPARLDHDQDVIPFVAIDSETDALPLGPVRAHWNADALRRLEPEIERAEIWAREFGSEACRKLVERFAS